MNDKLIEKERYDYFGQKLLDGFGNSKGSIISISTLEPYLQQPYLHLKNELEKNLVEGVHVLEIGAGTGIVTQWLVNSDADIVAIDISPKCVEFLNCYFLNVSGFIALEADMESLPFPNENFDIVVSAGSLSYAENDTTRDEIFRVMKFGGKFICLDSLNHNPIYKTNRYLHFIFGKRTKSTLKRMPTLKLIDSYKQVFGSSEVKFFGSLAWLAHLAGKFIGANSAFKVVNWFDRKFEVCKSAFKFVMVITKIHRTDEICK